MLQKLSFALLIVRSTNILYMDYNFIFKMTIKTVKLILVSNIKL